MKIQLVFEPNLYDFFSLLVNCGAHLNMCNYILGDYLCFAAAKGSLSILKSYKTAGVNMDLPNLSHRTALYEVCICTRNQKH